MATVTKTARTIQSSTSNSAGGTTTSSTWTLTTAFGGTLTVRITNGSTGPTVGCTATINISTDNSTWRTWGAVTADVTNNGIYDFAWDIPASVMYLQVVFAGNTNQAVTVEAYGQEITSIS